MEKHNNTASPTTPQLCTAGCGFYGSEHFLGLCSKCYGAKNKGSSNESLQSSINSPQLNSDNKTLKEDDTDLLHKIPRPSSSLSKDQSPSLASSTPTSFNTNTTATIGTTGTATNSATIKSPTAIPTKTLLAPTITTGRKEDSSISSSNNGSISSNNSSSGTSSSGATTPTGNNSKPIQTNKGRCFKCRIKVPLAKQTINKCRCDYVFCDSHRFPDRHDCEVDYAKLGRDLLAKNNPKLHERPKGGRSFKRIDSL